MSQETIEMLVTIICSCFASTGIWSFIQSRLDKNDAEKDLLIGIAHVRITELALKYLDRGYILKAEYDELYHYLYQPYIAAGGNGTCKELMDRVIDELKIYNSAESVPKELIKNERSQSDS